MGLPRIQRMNISPRIDSCWPHDVPNNLFGKLVNCSMLATVRWHPNNVTRNVRNVAGIGASCSDSFLLLGILLQLTSAISCTRTRLTVGRVFMLPVDKKKRIRKKNKTRKKISRRNTRRVDHCWTRSQVSSLSVWLAGRSVNEPSRAHFKRGSPYSIRRRYVTSGICLTCAAETSFQWIKRVWPSNYVMYILCAYTLLFRIRAQRTG